MKLPDLRSLLQPACAQFDKKTQRERLLMLTAVGALLYFITDASMLTPQQRSLRQLQAELDTRQAEILRIDAQIADLSARLAQQNASDRQTELDELMRIIAEADALLSENDGSSLKLSALLDAMLRTTPGLELMSLKTLPVVPLVPRGPVATDGSELKPAPPMVAGAQPAPEPPPVAVHQHGVELVIKGNYLALLPYMAKLRRYPKRLFWTAASLEVVKHPDSVLHLTITTLSEQRLTPLQ